jgi:hypothetical protein
MSRSQLWASTLGVPAFMSLFFVPDDTLLVDEASYLGIRSPHDLYGGVAPYRFAKTKAITHGLASCRAERPQGWSTAFAERVRGIVLPGYTVFSNRDARVAARHMLRRGPFRVKKPFSPTCHNNSCPHRRTCRSAAFRSLACRRQ